MEISRKFAEKRYFPGKRQPHTDGYKNEAQNDQCFSDVHSNNPEDLVSGELAGCKAAVTRQVLTVGTAVGHIVASR